MFKQQFMGGLLLLTMSQTVWSQGVIFNDSTYNLIPRAATQAKRGKKTVQSSASVKAFAPRAGHQGANQTCLAWSLAYALTIQEARVRAEKNPEMIMNSETIQKLFYSPAFIYNQIKDADDINCLRGVDFARAVETHLIQKTGILRYKDLKVECADEIPEALKLKAFKSIIAPIHRLMEPQKCNLSKIKAALDNNNPVIIAIKKTEYSEKTGKYETHGHAMCMVGYDDSFEGGSFEILNSYGTQWNDNGFGWISYQAFAETVYYAVEVPPLLLLPHTGRPEVLFNSKIQLLGIDSHALRLKQARGATIGQRTQNGHYSVARPVTEGFGYQILIDNNEPSYVYVLGFDTRKVVDVLFPQTNISPFLDKGSVITLPSDDQTIFFDDSKGADYCCILLSRNPLDIKALKKQIEAEAQKPTYKSFAKCLETLLKDKLAVTLTDNVKYEPQDGSLNLSMKSEQTITTVILQFDHR